MTTFCLQWRPLVPPMTTNGWHHENGVCVCYCFPVITLKRKGHQDDCPVRHWRRWRQASTSPCSDNHVSHRRPFRFCVTLLTAIHYIPRNKLMVHAFLWFVVVRYRSIIPISSKVVSLAPGQTYGYPSANETTLDAMGKWITRFHLQLMITTIKQTITKHVHSSYDFTGLILVSPSQWETALLCNGVSHWLGENLESALWYIVSNVTWLAAILVWISCCNESLLPVIDNSKVDLTLRV